MPRSLIEIAGTSGSGTSASTFHARSTRVAPGIAFVLTMPLPGRHAADIAFRPRDNPCVRYAGRVDRATEKRQPLAPRGALPAVLDPPLSARTPQHLPKQVPVRTLGRPNLPLLLQRAPECMAKGC